MQAKVHIEIPKGYRVVRRGRIKPGDHCVQYKLDGGLNLRWEPVKRGDTLVQNLLFVIRPKPPAADMSWQG